MKTAGISISLLLVLLGVDVRAAGFSAATCGARAAGQGGAAAALAGDATLVACNPAGIALVDGLQIQVGGTLLSKQVDFAVDGVGSSAASAAPQALPHAAVAYETAPGYVVALGFSSPFSGAIRWPASDPGRFVAREQVLRASFIHLAVGLGASSYVEGLSVAAGMDLVPASFRLRRDLGLGAGEGSLDVAQTAFGAGGRMGLFYRPPSLSLFDFGLAWRSPVPLRFRGRADFDVNRDVDATIPRSALPPDGDSASRITLPQSVLVGMVVRLGGGLQVQVGADWTDWSAFDRVEIELPGDQSMGTDRLWHDSFAARVGAEWSIGPAAFRCGYSLEPSPVPDKTLDPAFPDAGASAVSAGLTLRLPGGFAIDFSGNYPMAVKRTAQVSSVQGTYTFSGWRADVTLGLVIDQARPVSASDDKPAGETAAP